MATYTFLTPTLEQGLIGNHRLFQFFTQRTKGYTVINNAGVYSLTQYPAQDDLETYTAYYMGGCIHKGITDAIKTAMIAASIGITESNFTAELGHMKHWEHHPTPIDGCFGCKGLGLQMNSGDATRDIPDKKWNSELQAYRDARSQGIQPAGTRMKDIIAAHKASETLGKAYNSETMPKAANINKKSVEVLKEIGQI